MTLLNKYWEIVDGLEKEYGKELYKFIDYCGIEPIMPMKNIGYFCTPKNSKTFAATGGDGVHFGIVDLMLSRDNKQPIVMTVPMAEINNVVIAENINEFFSLGINNGWFGLEQIVYDLEETIDYYSKLDSEITESEKRFLDRLKQKIEVQYIPLSKSRLNQLKELYFERLEIGDVYE